MIVCITKDWIKYSGTDLTINMTKLFKNEYIIREAKGGGTCPLCPPPGSAFDISD